MIDYFQGGYDEAKYYTYKSPKKIKPICPYCNKISNKDISIHSINISRGFQCTCSDKISYPEKFFINFLDQLKIDYVYQATKNSLNWDTKDKRYDFYIGSKKCIIETHGKQHYEEINGIFKGKFKKIVANDKLKYELAKKNGIKDYVVIDCRESGKDWIKNSIMNSILPAVLNFIEEDIDWNECGKAASGNYCKEVCNYYNEHDVSIDDLVQKFRIDRSTIYHYLKIGNEVGWCDYLPNRSIFNSKSFGVYKNDTLVCYYHNVNDFLEKQNITNISRNRVYKYLKSGEKTPDGFSFVPVTDFKLNRKILCDKI